MADQNTTSAGADGWRVIAQRPFEPNSDWTTVSPTPDSANAIEELLYRDGRWAARVVSDSATAPTGTDPSDAHRELTPADVWREWTLDNENGLSPPRVLFHIWHPTAFWGFEKGNSRAGHYRFDPRDWSVIGVATDVGAPLLGGSTWLNGVPQFLVESEDHWVLLTQNVRCMSPEGPREPVMFERITPPAAAAWCCEVGWPVPEKLRRAVTIGSNSPDASATSSPHKTADENRCETQSISVGPRSASSEETLKTTRAYLVTREDIAAAFDVTPPTVSRWKKKAKFPEPVEENPTQWRSDEIIEALRDVDGRHRPQQESWENVFKDRSYKPFADE